MTLKLALEKMLKSGQSLKLLLPARRMDILEHLTQMEIFFGLGICPKANGLITRILSVDRIFGLDKIGEARPEHKLEMVIIGGKPWAVEFKNGAPVRYFDTVSGEFVDFNWSVLPGSEKLINQNIKIGSITGDFSIKAILNTQEGLGGGFNVKSPDGSRELKVTINRPKAVPLTKPTPELLVTLREGSKDQNCLGDFFGIANWRQ